MTTYWVLYAISAGTIVMGFIALLSQKIYLDKETNAPSEIEVPVFGKMKSNYPALLFVFLGIALAAWGFSKEIALDAVLKKEELELKKAVTLTPPTSSWEIKGNLKSDTGAPNWEEIPSLSPAKFVAETYKDGRFSVRGEVDKGKTICDIIESVEFNYADRSGYINLKEDYEKYKNNQPSSIEYVGESVIRYKTLTLNPGGYSQKLEAK